MASMEVGDIRATEVADGIEWSARVAYADQEALLRFGGPAELVDRADASMFLAATLLPAMAWHHDLHIDGSVSPLLLSRIDRLARMYRLMDPTLRLPEVTATAAAVPTSTGSATAAFFSRGADSTFTAAVPRCEPAPLDALVYCATLEPVHDAPVRAAELAGATAVAERLGLPLHVVWTDLRAFTDPMLGWSTMHGAGLGALALLVGQAFDHLVVATAYDLASLTPCGSNPAMDPLFSSEAVSIYHDDLDRSRQDKLDWLVAERPDLLALLKVCYADNRDDNCGRCHKCLLTMSGLRAAGGLHLATSFPAVLDLDAVRAQRVVGVGLRKLWLAIAHRADERGDRDLADAVGDLLRLSARPSLRELIGGRWPRLVGGERGSYDPERSTGFERFDRVHTNTELDLLRHGEVFRAAAAPGPRRLRAATVAGSLAASLAHRTRRARSG